MFKGISATRPCIYGGATLDGRCGSDRRRIRVEIHVAVVVLGERRSKSMRHSCNIAFGLSREDCRTFCDYRRRQVGWRSKVPADPLYQHLVVTAQRKSWRCVESGEPLHPFGFDPPKPRVEAVRVVDISSSNAWSGVPAVFLRTRSAHLEHEAAKAELKTSVPAATRNRLRPRYQGQTFKVRCDQLRSPQCGGQRCSGRVNRLAPWLLRSPEAQALLD